LLFTADEPKDVPLLDLDPGRTYHGKWAAVSRNSTGRVSLTCLNSKRLWDSTFFRLPNASRVASG